MAESEYPESETLANHPGGEAPVASDLSAEELNCLLHDDCDENAHTVSESASIHHVDTVSVRHPSESDASLSPASLTAIENLTRDFAERFAAELSRRLHIPVTVEVTQFDQPTFAEFVGQMEQPTCFQTITASAFGRPLHWEWSSQVLFRLLDRLLGGGQLPPTIARRALTEIERRLATNITEEMLVLFSESWHPVVPLAPKLQRIDTSPRSLTLVEPETRMWSAEFNVAMNDGQGAFRIAYQQSTIARFADALIAANRKAHMPAVVSVVLAESNVDADDLSGLRVGDILTLDSDCDEEAIVYIDDEPVLQGVAGAQDGRKAVRIASTADG